MEGITIAKAGACGIGGAGIVGATGYGAYTLVKPKTIGEQLVWDKYELLEKDSSLWSQLVTKYDSDQNKLNGDLTGETNEKKAEDLKAKCKTILDTPLTHTEATDNEKMNKAKRWCIKDPKVLKGSQ